MLALSWVAAFVACLAYGSASVLQSVGARRSAGVAGVSGVALILTQAPYLAGLAADGVAFAANVVALQQLPLFLVQSIITASVGVTAVIASLRGESLHGRDWVSLSVLATGLVLLGLTATSQSAVRLAPGPQRVILASVVLPLLIGLAATRLRGHVSSLVLAGAAGLAWTGVAVASRGLSAHSISWALLAQPLLWSIVLHGIVGTVFFALALQRGSVTTVTAVTFVLEMVIPSAVGLWLFGDSVATGDGPLAVFGFVLAVGGTISLTRFAT